MLPVSYSNWLMRVAKVKLVRTLIVRRPFVLQTSLILEINWIQVLLKQIYFDVVQKSVYVSSKDDAIVKIFDINSNLVFPKAQQLIPARQLVVFKFELHSVVVWNIVVLFDVKFELLKDMGGVVQVIGLGFIVQN